MAVKEIELTTLWERVIEEVAVDAPQHRAFLQLTKPLGYFITMIKQLYWWQLLISLLKMF